jgi:uncharacterized protein (DUF1800 family)
LRHSQGVVSPSRRRRSILAASAIALNRFGLGARPDQSALLQPQQWLLSQLSAYDTAPPAWQQVARTPALVDAWLSQQRSVRQAPEGQRSGI